MQHKLRKRMRQARDAHELDRVLSTASPAMRQRLLTMAHRINWV
jgi:hypothetical protein